MATAPEDISDHLKELTVSSSELHDESTEKSVGREIGRGAYSRVFTVQYEGSICAAKEIHSFLVEGVGQQQITERFLREYKHCSVLNHPNIVRFMGVSNLNTHSSARSSVPVMIMELMDKNLYDYINRRNINARKNDDYNTNSILRGVAKGLVYLHAHKPAVVHGNLSPKNILLKMDKGKLPVAKIGDRGVAKIIKADSKATQSMLAQVPGSVDFMPPESFGDSPVYDTPTDTFSYGCIMLFVFSQKWPIPSLKAKFDPVTKKYVTYSEFERRQQYLNGMTFGMLPYDPDRLEKTIKSCLSDDPSERPTMAAVAEEIRVSQ